MCWNNCDANNKSSRVRDENCSLGNAVVNKVAGLIDKFVYEMQDGSIDYTYLKNRVKTIKESSLISKG